MNQPSTSRSEPPAVRTDRAGLLLDQLLDAVTFSRSRLDGINNQEFCWEPAGPAWSIRPRGSAATPDAFGPADHVLDLDRSIPVFAPGPFTTTAWRIGHLASLFAGRWEHTFGDKERDPQELVDFTTDATTMLDLLWFHVDRWVAAIEGLADDELDTVGLSRYPFGLDQTLPFIAIVRWQNSETIHHLAEVALLRDLYRDRGYSEREAGG